MDALDRRMVGRTIYLWSDDNLSSDRLITPEGKPLLRRMEAYGRGYGKVCCLKGFDEASFAFNTGAGSSGFEKQLQILRAYAATDLDIYGYITFTSPPRTDGPDRVRRLADTLAGMRSDLLSRIVPLFVAEFSVMRPRIDSDAAAALDFQWNLMAAWTDAVGHFGRAVT